MFNLINRLEKWTSKGLITADQSKSILEYENSSPKKRYFYYLLLMLGVSVVGVGIISIIAANWERVPPYVKLLNQFILLGVTGFIFVRHGKNKRPLVNESLIAFILILILSSIGLISQIYHTGGKLYIAFLIWCLMVFPITLYSKKVYIPFIWGAALVLSGCTAILDLKIMVKMFNHSYSNMLLIMILPMVCVIKASILGHFAILDNYRDAFRKLAFLSGLFAMILAEIGFQVLFERTPVAVNINDAYIMYSIIIVVALATGVTISLRDGLDVKRKWITGFVLVSYSLMFIPSVQLSHWLVRAILLIITLMLTALFYSASDRERVTSFLIMIVGLRFLVLYFQAAGGLLATGIGMVISGVVIISGVILWHKKGEALVNLVGRIAK